jgi:glycerophosphoryl diester phosphodiesterase
VSGGLAERPAAGSSANRFRVGPGPGRPWVIAHRGDSAHAPENTLEAALRGWEAGADAWELDVQLTRDGVPVVLHDATLLRTTDVVRRFAADPRGAAGFLVADFDWAEVRTLDAGSWFLDPLGGPRTAVAFGTLERLDAAARDRFASGTVRVPSLAEALALTARLDWAVNVELKSVPTADPRLLDAVLAEVDRAGVAERVLISSFDHDDVARVARTRPDLATGVLVATPPFRPAAYVRDWVGADAYHPSTLAVGAGSEPYRRSPSPETLRTPDLASLSDAGVPILVYTVNPSRDGALADHLAAAGVAGIFTDDPQALLRQWGRAGRA